MTQQSPRLLAVLPLTWETWLAPWHWKIRQARPVARPRRPARAPWQLCSCCNLLCQVQNYIHRAWSLLMCPVGFVEFLFWLLALLILRFTQVFWLLHMQEALSFVEPMGRSQSSILPPFMYIFSTRDSRLLYKCQDDQSQRVAACMHIALL